MPCTPQQFAKLQEACFRIHRANPPTDGTGFFFQPGESITALHTLPEHDDNFDMVYGFLPPFPDILARNRALSVRDADVAYLALDFIPAGFKAGTIRLGFFDRARAKTGERLAWWSSREIAVFGFPHHALGPVPSRLVGNTPKVDPFFVDPETQFEYVVLVVDFPDHVDDPGGLSGAPVYDCESGCVVAFVHGHHNARNADGTWTLYGVETAHLVDAHIKYANAAMRLNGGRLMERAAFVIAIFLAFALGYVAGRSQDPRPPPPLPPVSVEEVHVTSIRYTEGVQGVRPGSITVRGTIAGNSLGACKILLLLDPMHPGAEGFFIQEGKLAATMTEDGAWTGEASIGTNDSPPDPGKLFSIAIIAGPRAEVDRFLIQAGAKPPRRLTELPHADPSLHTEVWRDLRFGETTMAPDSEE